MREKIRQVAKLRDLYYRIGLLVFMISLGVVLVSSSLSNAGDVAQILKVSGIDKDGALILSIETDKPFKDCKILDQKDKTHKRFARRSGLRRPHSICASSVFLFKTCCNEIK